MLKAEDRAGGEPAVVLAGAEEMSAEIIALEAPGQTAGEADVYAAACSRGERIVGALEQTGVDVRAADQDFEEWAKVSFLNSETRANQKIAFDDVGGESGADKAAAGKSLTDGEALRAIVSVDVADDSDPAVEPDIAGGFPAVGAGASDGRQVGAVVRVADESVYTSRLEGRWSFLGVRYDGGAKQNIEDIEKERDDFQESVSHEDITLHDSVEVAKCGGPSNEAMCLRDPSPRLGPLGWSPSRSTEFRVPLFLG
jgi:hypothetical protein